MTIGADLNSFVADLARDRFEKQQQVEQGLQQQADLLSKLQDCHTWASELTPELTTILGAHQDLFQGLRRVEVERVGQELKIRIYHENQVSGVGLTFEPFCNLIRHRLFYWNPALTVGYGGPVDIKVHNKKTFRLAILDSLKAYLKRNDKNG